MKGCLFLFPPTLRKLLSKRRTPLLEIPDRIDLLWHLEFQSDSSKIASATKTFKMWSKQPFPLLLACVTEMASHSAGFTLATDIQVTRRDPGGISQVRWNQWKLRVRLYSNLVALPNPPVCSGTRARPLLKPSLPQVWVYLDFYSIFLKRQRYVSVMPRNPNVQISWFGKVNSDIDTGGLPSRTMAVPITDPRWSEPSALGPASLFLFPRIRKPTGPLRLPLVPVNVMPLAGGQVVSTLLIFKS